MKTKHTLLTFILAGLLALGLLAGSSLHANAAKAVPRYATVLLITKIPTMALGQPVIVSGTLRVVGGGPVANHDVLITLNGVKLGRAHTDANGFFQRKFSKISKAGTYTIAFSTKKTHYLLGTTASTSLQILPADVHIQTVPAIQGIAFSMNGQQFFTGADGVAHVAINQTGNYQLTVLPEQYNNPNQRIQFARWLDEVYKPTETVKIPNKKVLQVGLNVYQQVGETFVDLSGFLVNPQRVKQFTIRSAQGDLFTFTDGRPAWIPASRVARFQNGLIVTNLEYSVISMFVDGSNVVNKSQQRYFAHPNDTWKVALILYTLNVHANDGLFGSSVGKSISLVYPDGHIQDYPLDQNGTASIHALARGNYTVQVLNDKGLKQIIPVALSRSQTVEINVATNLDLFFILGLGLLVGLSLIVFPRLLPWRSRARSTRPRPAIQSPQNALVKSNELQMVKEEVEQPKRGIIKWS
jgi:hypothetical protein